MLTNNTNILYKIYLLTNLLNYILFLVNYVIFFLLSLVIRFIVLIIA